MRKNDNLTSPPRSRTSVAISGLDRSTPDDMVKDGACEELHNLRYKDAAWRPVHDFSSVQLSLDSTRSGKICYKHPATSEDKYIYVYYDGATRKWFYYEISTSTANLQDATLIASFDESQKISHFGKVLIFTSDNKNTYFKYEGGRYGEVNIHLDLPELNISYLDTSNNNLKKLYWKVDQQINLGPNYPITPNTYYPAYRYEENIFDKAIAAIANGSVPVTISTAQQIHNVTQDTSPATYLNGLIWGNLCLFAAYRMSDGAILQVSPLSIVSREHPYNVNRFIKGKIIVRDPYQNAEELFEDDYIWAETNGVVVSNTENTNLTTDDPRLNTILYSVPQVDIKLPQTILDNNIVETIAIYATRLYPPFNKDLFEDIRGDIDLMGLFNPIELPDQPFYLVKEFLREEFVDNEGALQLLLTPSLLQRAIHNQVYTPNNMSMVSGGALLDYNNRLHIADTTTYWGNDPHFKNPYVFDISAGYLFSAGIEVKTNDGHLRLMGDYQNSNGEFKSPYDRILSYPNVAVAAFLTHSSRKVNADKYTAKTSYANNFAYVVNTPNNDYQFPQFNLPQSSPVPIDSLLFEEVAVREPNKVLVSSANNPFSLPFENSYAIGSASNRIIALQSAAIEMSDAKFGEFPLFAFTDEGIFALQAGSETLYASVIPINYDKIINPNTLAINGAIIYITEEGVHMLTNKGTQLISSPIHGSDGRPPLDFLRTCQIIWPKEHNEVIFHNPDNDDDVAYVFNIDAGYWSTRTLVGTKINTDEMVAGNSIYDLADEDETKALPMTIATRPIKLGNVEFKRLDTIVPRMSSGDNTVISHVHLTGSVNGTDYMTLREHEIELEPHKVNPFTLRRTPFSAKYFKYHMFMEPEKGETFNPSITHIDFEWYTKFQRRMR